MNTRNLFLQMRNVSLTLSMLLSINASAQTTANAYIQHNLVSDVAGAADVTDPNLINPWGISQTATSPFWVSDNATGKSTLYNGSGAITAVVVTIPPGAATQGIGSPTGQVAGNGTNWLLPDGKVASFIFATEDGTIAAWNSGVTNSTAVTMVDNSSAEAVYNGLASSPTGTPLLYAPNFHTGNVDVFDANFKATTVTGGFIDPNLPAGYAPFNIQNLGGKLYVTYAVQDPTKKFDVAGAGNGVVNIFDLNGNLLQRLTAGGALNAPWGVALAPAGWGIFGGDVLVGNFGDGKINGYDPKTGNFIATMLNGTTVVGGPEPPNGTEIFNTGLWALQFGNGKSGGDPQTLYITSSFNNNDNKIHGLLAALAPPTQVTGIVNAAGYTGGSISPGEIVLINGFNMGPSPLATGTVPATGTVGTTAGSTTVTFNGTLAPVLYSSASAIGVIVPYEVFGSTTATVVVTYKTGFVSPSFTIPVTETAPGLFTVSETGSGEVIAYNFDGTLNTASNPVTRGFPVIVYATGEGQTDPTGSDGLIASGLFVRTPFATVTAAVAGQPANVVYAGSAAGNVAGIMEVELIVPALPATTPAGALPITLTVGGVNSQAGTTIFVK